MTANGNSKVKDMIAAETVGKLLEFGYFDTSFIQYGGAYWKNGEAHYVICDNSVDLYKHIHSLGTEEKYSTPIYTFRDEMHVPLGMKEVYDSKLHAQNIKKMKEKLPKEYFEIIHSIPLVSHDAAVEILAPIQEALVARSHNAYLNIFQSLVEFARERHQLTYETYLGYLEWLEKERAFIVERISRVGTYSSTYFGFLYSSEGQKPQLYATATESSMIRKREEFRSAGKKVSPVFQQHYTYSDLSERAKLRDRFKGLANMYLDAGYMETVDAIYNLPSPISQEAIDTAEAELKKADLGEDVERAWKARKMAWGIQ